MPTGKRKKISDDKILSLLRDSEGHVSSAPELAKKADMTRQGLFKRLEVLEEDGLVRKHKLSARTVVWQLVEN
jgi:predicted transcriptional regulator